MPLQFRKSLSLCQITSSIHNNTTSMRKRFKLKAGDTRTFELESHEGGGYLWSVVSNDECVKVQLSKKTPSKDDGKQPLGKSFPVLVEIKALSEGQAIAVLEEKRPWEKDIKPLNTCRIYITIK